MSGFDVVVYFAYGKFHSVRVVVPYLRSYGQQPIDVGILDYENLDYCIQRYGLSLPNVVELLTEVTCLSGNLELGRSFSCLVEGKGRW